MFTDLALGKEISEHYTDFTEETLLAQKPIPNWPTKLGQLSAAIVLLEQKKINGPLRLMVHGSAGRSTLEIIRKCSNLRIDHTGCSAPSLDVLRCLLDNFRIDWHQQIEGQITEERYYLLQEGESGENLLEKKNNEVEFTVIDYDGQLPAQLTGYDVIVADFRYKDSAERLEQVSQRLRNDGILILGSIDDPKAEEPSNSLHSLNVLLEGFKPEHFDVAEWGSYPHIYKQTRNKHQYAITNFSTWRKNSAAESSSQKIQSSKTSQDAVDYYEDENILTSYDRFHFGQGLLGVENFPLRMAQVCIEACKKYNAPLEAALDAGCGPGRTALELSSTFAYVEAYDYSQGFVNMMKEKIKSMNVSNLIGYQGDSHHQIDICQRKKFDLIHGCNLIDRLHHPKDWVLQSKEMLTANGLLVIASPYTWLPEHTPIENWIGGFETATKKKVYTIDGLKDLLGPELELLEVQRVPFVIPDADGTFQYTYSNCAIFGKRR